MREHNLMRAMGWTPEELKQVPKFERERHYAILEYEQRKTDAAARSAQHETQRRHH